MSKSLLFLFFILLCGIELMAQPGLPVAPTQAPIDGGLSLLALAGGIFAVKKLRKDSEND